MRLDELRTALAEQAGEVIDSGGADRVDAVRGRVRTIQRRRAVAVTASAVLAVVATVVGLPLLLDAMPRATIAPVTLADQPVPTTKVANGFTYRYVRGVEGEPGEGELSLTVNPRQRTMLISFASSDDDAVLTLRAGGDDLPARSSEVAGSVGGAFENFLLLRGGRQQVTLTQAGDVAGRLALAVYRPSGDLPDGVTNGQVVFREDLPGYELVDGLIGAPGETELSFEITPPEGPLLWSHALCYDGRDNSYLRYSIDGIPGPPRDDMPCGMPPPKDPHNLEPGYLGGTLDPASRGEPVTVRMWLAHGRSGEVLTDPDAVIGLGVYAESVPRLEVAGVEVLSQSAAFGHTWRAVDRIEIPAGTDVHDLTLPPSDVPRTITTVSPPVPEEDPYAIIVSVIGGDDWGYFVNASSPTAFPHLMVLPGAERRVEVRISDGRVSSMPIGLVVWEQVR